MIRILNPNQVLLVHFMFRFSNLFNMKSNVICYLVALYLMLLTVNAIENVGSECLTREGALGRFVAPSLCEDKIVIWWLAGSGPFGAPSRPILNDKGDLVCCKNRTIN